jgi:hypothetical protein
VCFSQLEVGPSRFGRRERACLAGRRKRMTMDPLPITGLVEVKGESRRPARPFRFARAFERKPDGLVDQATTIVGNALVHQLPELVMNQLVRSRPNSLHQPFLHQHAERELGPGFGEVERSRQHFDCDLLAAHRQRFHAGTHPRLEPVDAVGHELAERAGDRLDRPFTRDLPAAFACQQNAVPRQAVEQL